MKKLLTLLIFSSVLLAGCGNASTWKLASGQLPDADPNPIVFEGSAVLSGWGVEVPYYTGTPELHFHVASESLVNLPKDFDFKKYDWNFKLENSTEDFNKVLKSSTQTSQVEIAVDSLTIVQEGNPIMHLVQY